MIIEIAFGIVLAVLILVFLRELIGLGIILFLLALLLAVVGILVYLGRSNPDSLTMVLILAIAVIPCVGLAKYINKNAPIKRLQKEIGRRKKLGYDTRDLEQQLARARVLASPNTEEKRRRTLGYNDTHDDA